VRAPLVLLLAAACTPRGTCGAAGGGEAAGVSASVPARSASTSLGARSTFAPEGSAGVDAPVTSLAQGVLPAERVTAWNPGLTAVGGIPRRTVVFRTVAPSGGDDTAIIQAALDACPPRQIVQLETGTFKITEHGLTIGRSDVVLRGRGPDKTHLVKPEGTNYPVIIIGRRWYKYTQPTDIVADVPKGQSSVVLARDPGLKPGELVLVDELTDDEITYWGPNAPPGGPQRGWFCRYDRPVGQMLEIARVTGSSGATVTFTTPFHIGFVKNRRPQLVRIAADPDAAPIDAVRFSGVEDLHVANGEGGDGGGNIHLFATAYSWVKNVEAGGSVGQGINFDGAFRSELRDSYIHSTRDPNPGGGGYGVGVNSHAADNLIENNAIWNFNKVDCFRASGGGNVFGYNYLEDGFGAGYPAVVEVGLNASHFTTPHAELFEGNQAFNFDSDTYWGNAVNITVFRNHFTAKRRSVPPVHVTDEVNRRAVGLTHHNWWFSFVANVLGTERQTAGPGRSFVVEKNGAFDDWTRTPMWQLGYDGQTWSPPQDAKVVATTIRHANFDYVSGRSSFDPRLPRMLPASLYFTSKPEFFGDEVWPFVDPARTPKVGTLPARRRFDAAHEAH
jgi:hypothetical protein